MSPLNTPRRRHRWIGGFLSILLVLPLAAAAPAGAEAMSPPPSVSAPAPLDDVAVHRPRQQTPNLAPSLQDDHGRPTDARTGTSRSSGSSDVVVETGDTATARRSIADAGGTITIDAGDLLEADVPTDQLDDLAAAPGVSLVREPRQLVPAAVTSEGVAKTGDSSWITAGWKGQNTRVAILDSDFNGLSDAVGSELPSDTAVDFSRCSGNGSDGHGTAVAEIVSDMAPEADLLLVCIRTDAQFVDAMNDLPADVDIVNGSFGFTLEGRGDGTGPISTAVKNARARGVLYVASAGNYGETHYTLNAVGDAPGDTNDDYVNISSDDAIGFAGVQGQPIGVSLQWDAWPTTKQDFDLYLVDAQGHVIDSSTVDQAGGPEAPIEFATLTPASTGTVYYVLVNRFSGTAQSRLDFYFDGPVVIEHHNAGGISDPASSPAAMAVGANCVNNESVEPFSSRGPTIDGRIKPDISGPDATSGPIYGANNGCGGETGFFGTSAAAPHVAGAAAQVLSASPDLDVAELQQTLQSRALATGNPNNDVGHGKLRMGTPGSAAVPIPQPFTPTAPVRLFDSRPDLQGVSEATDYTAKLGAAGKVRVQVSGIAGVPADATAVVLNVTATGPTANTFLTVHPGGTLPTASNINVNKGHTLAGHVTATVAADHKVEIYNSAGATHVIVDLTGWYGPTGASGSATDLLHTLPAPNRAYDTRAGVPGYAEGGGSGVAAKLGPTAEASVQVAGLGGVPADATAVVVNVTITGASKGTYIAAYPEGGSVPATSTLNASAKETIANLAVLPVGDDGKIRFFNAAGEMDLLVDTIGWYAPGAGGAGYVAQAPVRELDSRTGTGFRTTALPNGGFHNVTLRRYADVPVDATAVLLGVVAAGPTATGYLRVYPSSAAAPNASNVNFAKGITIANAAVSGLGTAGAVAFRNTTLGSGTTHVISDLFGYFMDPTKVPVALVSPAAIPTFATSWHPPASLPASGNVAYMEGDVGDYISQGQTHTATAGNELISVSWDGNQLHFSMTLSGDPYGGSFEPAGDALAVGDSGPIHRIGFFNPGMEVTAPGRGCNTLTGRVVVDSVTVVASTLTAITFRLQQACESTFPDQVGVRMYFRWTAP